MKNSICASVPDGRDLRACRLRLAAALVTLVVLGLSIPNLSSAATSAAKVTIDAGAERGPLPKVFRAGVFTNEHPLDGTFETYFRDLKPGAVELVPIRDGNFSSLEDYLAQLPSLPSTRWIEAVAKHGGRPVVAFMEIPPWLQQRRHRDGNYRLPADWDGWSNYVQATVAYYKSQLGVECDYVVWDEPDLQMFWKEGGEQDYFRLYRATVLGARRADPHARVGGPAVSYWMGSGPGADGKTSMLYNFLAYVAHTPLPELNLPRLPLDFVVWHQFNTDRRGSATLYLHPAEQIRSWLTELGLGDAELSIGSWNSWMTFGKDRNELSAERDDEFGAAYVIDAVVRMDAAGIDSHSFFNLVEGWQWQWLKSSGREAEFRDRDTFGGFGLLTRTGRPKPAFRAFAALSRVTGTRLGVANDDPYLSVIAARDGKRLAVLLANFHWPDETRFALKARWLLEHGHRLQDMTAWVSKLKAEEVAEVDAGRRELASLAIPDHVKRDFAGLVNLDRRYATRDESRSVSLTIHNLATTLGTTLEHQVIDASTVGAAADARAPAVARRSHSRPKALAALADLLLPSGAVVANFRSLDEESQTVEIRRIFPTLSDDLKRQTATILERISREDQAAPSAAAAGSSSGVKRRVEVGLQAPIEFEMAPYSVHLLIFTIEGT